MKHKSIALALAMVMGLSLTACGSKTTETTQPSGTETTTAATESTSDDALVIKIGHAQSEDGDWHKGLEVFRDKVAELSNGTMEVQIYANETLGPEADNIAAVQQGTCEGVVTGDTMSNWTPYAALLAAPYAANTLDDLITIADSEEVGSFIEEQVVENVQLHPIGFFIRSARELTSTKPIKSIDDVKGLKIRVPNSPLQIALWNAFGASATPIASSEVFSSLQNGTVEAQENPYANIISMNIPEVCKYLVQTDHVYSWIYVTLGENFWQSLTSEQQDIIDQAAQEMEKYQWDYLKEQVSEQENALKEQMEFIEIDKAPFQEIAKNVMKEQLDPEVYELYTKMVELNK